jgi:hypothetical protein
VPKLIGREAGSGREPEAVRRATGDHEREPTPAEAAGRKARGDGRSKLARMCKNIRTLHNFEPPATHEEIRASALQYVRKISGYNKPSRANAEAFDRAVDAVAAASSQLLSELVTSAPPKDREVEAAKARARSAQRYAA